MEVPLEIVDWVSFLHAWALLFWIYMLGFGVPFMLEAHSAQVELPIRPWRYVAVVLTLAPFTHGVLPQLLVILPVFVYRAGYVLAEGSGTTTFRAVTRWTLILLAVTVFFGCLQPKVDGLGVSLGLAGAAIVVGIAAGGHASAAADRLDVTRRELKLAHERERRRILVHVGQTCPYCRDALRVDTAHAWGYCSECKVLLHRDCAAELGGCPTLGCAERPLGRVGPKDLRPVRRERLRPKLATPADRFAGAHPAGKAERAPARGPAKQSA